MEERPVDTAAIAGIVHEYAVVLADICEHTARASAELAPWNPCQRELDRINVSVQRAAEVTQRLAQLADDDLRESSRVHSLKPDSQ